MFPLCDFFSLSTFPTSPTSTFTLFPDKHRIIHSHSDAHLFVSFVCVCFKSFFYCVEKSWQFFKCNNLVGQKLLMLSLISLFLKD